MLRQKTPVEQQRFRSYFQNLHLSQMQVTGEPSSVYNCVAWSVGLSGQWLWPGNKLSDFDYFYSLFGFERSRHGSIAVMGHANDTITHTAVQREPEKWESKCGADLRIRHTLAELSGSTYGKVIAYYAPLKITERKADKLLSALADDNPFITPEQIDLLEAKIEEVPKKMIIDFEKLFEDWRNSWFAGRLAVNSNPGIRTGSYEFFKMAKMGPAIIPLVVQKLSFKGNFFALQLYERIQPNHKLAIKNDIYDKHFLEGEQGRAFRNASMYIDSLAKKAVS